MVYQRTSHLTEIHRLVMAIYGILKVRHDNDVIMNIFMILLLTNDEDAQTPLNGSTHARGSEGIALSLGRSDFFRTHIMIA